MAEKPRAGGAAAVARVRASKAEFKRLDEVYASLGGALQVGANRNRYNKLFHRYDLKESSSSAPGKDGKWDDNAFLVRRKFGTKSLQSALVYGLRAGLTCLAGS